MNNKKGFTLIELLVVVLIIGILAAMALPQYFKAVERSRMSEAVTLLANIAQAQQRKYLQINKYVENFRGLDVAPKGAAGENYYTKGNPTTGVGGNGFVITIEGTAFAGSQGGKATADRVAEAVKTGLQYDYTLTRYYASNDVTCKGNNENGALLCADFCGIDTLSSGGECCSNNTGSAGACEVPGAND